MKKIFILTIASLIFSSCDVLDVKPYNRIPAEDALKDKAGIEKGILGAYGRFQYLSYYGRAFMIFSDLAADNLENPIDGTASDYREIDNNTILPENGGVYGIWASAYEGINAANNVIAKVPDIADMTPEEKEAALGELYFIRALNHFNVMIYFGSVPIKTTPSLNPDDVNVPRKPVEDVYAQIVEDLEYAALHLPESSVKVRATKYAAIALLARVHLYMGEYEEAIVRAAQVIEDGGYTLLEDYADVFDADGSAETIFEIDFIENTRNRIAEYNFPKSLNGRREVAPTSDILDAYEPSDERYTATIAFDGALAYPIKYDDLGKGADNVIVIRLAEMYLIRAEANAKLEQNLSDVQDDINEIRSRASLGDTGAATYTSLLAAIEQERWVEFAFEGHRWFDLVRTDRAMDVLDNITNINKTLFPIPASEILTNTNPDMKQNPGY
jgi:tetratricopeptide (TPR) repeat protein